MWSFFLAVKASLSFYLISFPRLNFLFFYFLRVHMIIPPSSELQLPFDLFVISYLQFELMSSTTISTAIILFPLLLHLLLQSEALFSFSLNIYFRTLDFYFYFCIFFLCYFYQICYLFQFDVVEFSNPDTWHVKRKKCFSRGANCFV